MALKAQSLFLYGFQVTITNQKIDFKNSGGGSTLTGVLNLGYYSLTDLMAEIARAMNAADATNTYTVTANRTLSGGLQNRVTIATSGAFLSLLFLTGLNNAQTIALTIGFTKTDQTGATSYTGVSTCGTSLLTTMTGYSYTGPTRSQKVFGSVNVSTSGAKEAIVFQIQQFLKVTFKYEPEAIIDSTWVPLLTWMIEQRPFEFTPEYTTPATFYNVTLEQTPQDGSGLAFELMEELQENLPFLYSTGELKMRIKT